MNDCYLSLLLNFRALLSIDSGVNLVNSKQAIGVILPDLSLLGYEINWKNLKPVIFPNRFPNR